MKYRNSACLVLSGMLVLIIGGVSMLYHDPFTWTDTCRSDEQSGCYQVGYLVGKSSNGHKPLSVRIDEKTGTDSGGNREWKTRYDIEGTVSDQGVKILSVFIHHVPGDPLRKLSVCDDSSCVLKVGSRQVGQMRDIVAAILHDEENSDDREYDRSEISRMVNEVSLYLTALDGAIGARIFAGPSR